MFRNLNQILRNNLTKGSGIVCLWFTCALASAAPAPDLWSFWATSNEDSSVSLDHSAWQQFLDDYVSVSDDGVNRVAYDAAAESGRTLLTGYIDALTSMDPRQLTADEQYAYWVNLYNALTVDLVLNYPKKKSILRMGKGFFSIGPWDETVATIAGQEVTLNDIEHRILRPIWDDQRIHFAVNCASFGCPNLNKTAYTAANLEDQLDLAEQTYLNHPRGVLVDERGRVKLSSIFKWYQADFGLNETEVLDYIAEFNDAVAKLDRTKNIRVKYDYDWSLNSTPNR